MLSRNSLSDFGSKIASTFKTWTIFGSSPWRLNPGYLNYFGHASRKFARRSDCLDLCWHQHRRIGEQGVLKTVVRLRKRFVTQIPAVGFLEPCREICGFEFQ